MSGYINAVKQKKPRCPRGYDSVDVFLGEMRNRYTKALGCDQENRDAAREDIEFTYGKQWDDTVREQRSRKRKPIITVNRAPAFVAQVVNNRLLNETEIRVHPDVGGTKEVAELRQSIIRSVFKNSSADYARDDALKYQVISGFGAYALEVGFSSDDVFDQEIRIKHIPDPFSVVVDEMSAEPTGADARFAFVGEDIDIEVFRKRYPWASTSSFATDTSGWVRAEAIRVVSYWCMVEEGQKTLVLLTNGTTQRIDDEEALLDLMMQGLVATKDDGSPYIREVANRFARMYLCSGNDVLAGPYDLPISSIPVFRVPGWELRDGSKTMRWGLMRFLKDPMRLHNYARSTSAEQYVAAPRNKWIATRDAVSGYENDWRTSNISDDPLLLYNAEGGMPQRIQPAPIDMAMVNEANTTMQDIRDVSNIHEASLGMKSNEVSGKALQARQSMADLGTFIYHDRLRMADERCAMLINELIPTVYDTQRLLKIVGTDNKAIMVMLNDPFSPNTDVTLGKYGVTVSTGPATITKRALAAEQMMAFVNAVPQTAATVMDLVAEAQDWPKADEFARRFRIALPPGMVSPEDLPEDMQAQMQQGAQKAEIEAQMQQKMAQLEMAKVEAETAELMARAEQLKAQAYKSISDAQARTADVESKTGDRQLKSAITIAEKELPTDGY